MNDTSAIPSQTVDPYGDYREDQGQALNTRAPISAHMHGSATERYATLTHTIIELAPAHATPSSSGHERTPEACSGALVSGPELAPTKRAPAPVPPPLGQAQTRSLPLPLVARQQARWPVGSQA